MQPEELSVEALFAKGVEQFNRGEFFAQHETFEDLWVAEKGQIRYLYQGILQVGVGFYHLERGNYNGALKLWRTALEYLLPFSPHSLGIDVARLIADTETARDTLTALGPERLAEFDPRFVARLYRIGDRY